MPGILPGILPGICWATAIRAMPLIFDRPQITILSLLQNQVTPLNIYAFSHSTVVWQVGKTLV
jgi:hypothetical protein